MPKIVIHFAKKSLKYINTLLQSLLSDKIENINVFEEKLIDFLSDEYKRMRQIEESIFIKNYLVAIEYVIINNDFDKLFIENELTDFFKHELSTTGKQYLITEYSKLTFDNSIDFWFNEVNKELINTIEFDNDDFEIVPENRETFIKKNLRLVINCAKRYRYIGIPFEDLIQTGNIGLINAYDNYDATRSKIRQKVIDIIKLCEEHPWSFNEAYNLINENVKYVSNTSKVLFDNIPKDGFENNLDFINWCKENIKTASLASVAYIMIRSEILVTLSSNRQVKIPYKKLANGYTNFISLDQSSPSTGHNAENSLMNDKSKQEFFVYDDYTISDEDNQTLLNLLNKYINTYIEPEEQYIISEYFGLESNAEVNHKELAEKLNLAPRQLKKEIKKIVTKIFQKIPKAERDYISELL